MDISDFDLSEEIPTLQSIKKMRGFGDWTGQWVKVDGGNERIKELGTAPDGKYYFVLGPASRLRDGYQGLSDTLNHDEKGNLIYFRLFRSRPDEPDGNPLGYLDLQGYTNTYAWELYFSENGMRQFRHIQLEGREFEAVGHWGALLYNDHLRAGTAPELYAEGSFDWTTFQLYQYVTKVPGSELNLLNRVIE